jgi:hypothetical protein
VKKKLLMSWNEIRVSCSDGRMFIAMVSRQECELWRSLFDWKATSHGVKAGEREKHPLGHLWTLVL